MRKIPQLVLVLIIIGIVSWFGFLASRVNFQLLNPHGLIALQERDLIVMAMGIMLSIAIPIMLLAFFVAWKYKAGNKKSKYMPEWTGNRYIKLGYLAFLSCLALIFFSIVWESAHNLDPYKPITSNVKPVTIQVVALQWKWLFIYPEQNIATVNFIQIPVNTPVNFELTADAPMNSFWIPSLSGQIYAMTTMETKIHMMANTTGDFPGGAAEINGRGFSGMRFITHSGSKTDFDKWVEKVQSSSNPLDDKTYEKLSKPSEDNPVTYYSSVDSNLYNNIMMKYMAPTSAEETEHEHMEGMEH